LELRLAGFRPVSCSDGLPGEVVAVVWLQGCPLRCPWCHNPETRDKSGGKEVDVDDVVKALSRYSPYLDVVVISGGEPLAHDPEELTELAEGVEKMGLDPVLDTSGYPPERLAEVVGAFTRVALDLKAELREETYLKATGGVMGAEDLLAAAEHARTVTLELRITTHPLLGDPKRVAEDAETLEPDVVIVQPYTGRGKGPDPEELGRELSRKGLSVYVRPTTGEDAGAVRG